MHLEVISIKLQQKFGVGKIMELISGAIYTRETIRNLPVPGRHKKQSGGSGPVCDGSLFEPGDTE